MISPTRLPLPASFTAPPSALVESLLAEQSSLTAVERFSARMHAPVKTGDAGGTTAEFENRMFYRDLIPLREPGPREQYAFEVDLDRCTGCKACVTGCHSMNGLDAEETWRSVGLLQKVASVSSPALQQHVTTACHHCIEPGCAQGCPTLAYEKDPITGVVSHLDDQCFGCQYCILKCPYDVPQYNAEKGIVRKCDLCVGRLRAGEAPACAQACPTQAIRVTLVDTAAIRAEPTETFTLPGAPDPTRVMPTTRYTSASDVRMKTQGLVSADSAQVRPEHAHLPLVAMLVASQAAAGYWILLVLTHFLSPFFLPTPDSLPPTPTPLPLAELFGFVGIQFALGLSLLHLGRPWLAWKAFLGWRRSWLSREVIAFTALAGSTGAFAMLALAEWFWGFALPTLARSFTAGAVVLSAGAAIHASAMVYRDTPRALWATRDTLWKFALTAAICGIPGFVLVHSTISPLWGGGGALQLTLLLFLPALQGMKLLLESKVFHRRDDTDFNPLWKAAQLMSGTLRSVWFLRLALGTIGGILLPLSLATGALPGPSPLWIGTFFILVVAGELLERYLFFTTAVAPRMPGGRK